MSTVFVVDDDSEMQVSIEFLLSSVNLHTETYSSAQLFFDTVKPDQPGCVLLDIRMPEMSGLELQKRLLENNILLPVIIITGHGDVPTTVKAMKGGAINVIEKPYNDQILIDTIHAALRLDEYTRRIKTEQQEIKQRLDELTPREHEVLDLIIAGNANKEIAKQLKISEKTVEAHRANLMSKMHAHSTADLVRTVTVHRISIHNLHADNPFIIHPLEDQSLKLLE